MEQRRPVRRLDIEVVNRIAAGEVVQRPASALKEMIENSLDAKSTTIQVIVKDGGMKFLQIQDNGIGINKDDLGIICERFTTSKLQTFDELRSISTYGFRGEALSSISHIAHITVVTKTAEERCGYKVSYIDGKVKSPPVPCGANQGTQITVENFFYNVPTRQKSLKNANEEFQRIYDVVSRYAVHNSTVGFSLKLFGRDATKVKTLPKSTVVDNIRSIFGNVIARDLMEVQESDEMLQLKIYGQVTNLNYHTNKFAFLLFINHRLVEADGLKKELDQLYSMYLPQGTRPFIYLSLEMAPQNVDVNVHPTKHSVFYLHEDAINKKIKATIQRLILGKQACRTYQVQVLSQQSMTNPLSHEKTENVEKVKPQIYAHEKVRTDSSDQKLDRFLCRTEKIQNVESDELARSVLDESVDMEEKRNNVTENEIVALTDKPSTSSSLDISNDSRVVDESGVSESVNVNVTTEPCEDKLHTMANFSKKLQRKDSCLPNNVIQSNVTASGSAQQQRNSSVDEMPTTTSPGERREFNLTSLVQLRKAVVDNCHHELKDVLRSACYVGCVDDYILMQHGTNLYLCKIIKLCEEFFYQVLLSEFGNLDVMKLSTPLKIFDLLKCAFDRNNGSCSDEDVNAMIENLKEKSVMLEDYFSLEINEDGCLGSIPWLLKNYSPCPLYLPEFVLGLAMEVDWSEEKACFHGICKKIAELYSRPSPEKEGTSEKTHGWNWTIEHIIFPNLKKHVYPSKTFVETLSLCHITRLKDLYTVFERC